ncbi:hypothetical protein NIES4103_58340 [Nostoc sp. NIES-4103]|nr:hypothetical protein NIES4103_58340 [Nostoc sp. NIES-4103]
MGRELIKSYEDLEVYQRIAFREFFRFNPNTQSLITNPQSPLLGV